MIKTTTCQASDLIVGRRNIAATGRFIVVEKQFVFDEVVEIHNKQISRFFSNTFGICRMNRMLVYYVIYAVWMCLLINSISTDSPPLGNLCRFGENNRRFGLFFMKKIYLCEKIGCFQAPPRFVKSGSYD